LFENAAQNLGGKSHLKLNIGKRPIAHKYREGKMQSTLKRESNQYLKLSERKQSRLVTLLAQKSA